MRPLHHYVGPRPIADRARTSPHGRRVERPTDLLAWIRDSGQRPHASGVVVATFVIDAAGALRVADRRSEHVACAGGEPVRSGGPTGT